MEKRVLLAVVLSFIVLYGYQVLFVPPKPAQQPQTAPQTSKAVPPAAESPSSQSAVSTPKPEAAEPVLSDTAERDVIFESDAVRAVFSTRGGVLKSWQLKKYFDAGGRPLEIIPQHVPDGTPKPFTLTVADADVSATLGSALYKPGATEVHPQPNGAATVVFDYKDASGLAARKEFEFPASQPYVFLFSATVSRGDAIVPDVEFGPALGTGIVASGGGTYNPPPQPIFYRDGKVTRVSATKIQDNAVQDGVFGFAGADDHYFLSATVAGGQPLQVRYRPLVVPGPTPEQTAHFVDWSVRYSASPAKTRFFLGPKDFDVLAAVDRDLVRAIDFGMFAWIVVPLLRALKWVNVYVGNYGWSIIILTVLINLAMFPLRHKSVVSMRRMQEIQPEVKAIQDRYAKLSMTDPARQKMNVELMNLYRERGVNPASGCVPMLLTLPVLFAFYSMLSVAIELRGAPFVGWIKDLSVHDPLYITPIVMGITQFVQTKMTPTTADPMQQRMMLFMPLIMMTMFVWAPSGLVLYWTVSNIWAIGQQAFTNRLIGRSQKRTARPPAERRVKSVGGGKSEGAAKERK